MASYFVEHDLRNEENSNASAGASRNSQSADTANIVVGSDLIEGIFGMHTTNNNENGLRSRIMNALSRFHEIRERNSDFDQYDSLLETMISQLTDATNYSTSYPTDKIFIKKLPRYDRTTLDKNLTCTICSEDFSSSETANSDNVPVLKLPCNHYFDEFCVMPWLDVNNTCPVCRNEMPSDHPDWIKKRKEEEEALYKQQQEDLMYG